MVELVTQRPRWVGGRLKWPGIRPTAENVSWSPAKIQLKRRWRDASFLLAYRVLKPTANVNRHYAESRRDCFGAELRLQLPYRGDPSQKLQVQAW